MANLNATVTVEVVPPKRMGPLYPRFGDTARDVMLKRTKRQESDALAELRATERACKAASESGSSTEVTIWSARLTLAVERHADIQNRRRRYEQEDE